MTRDEAINFDECRKTPQEQEEWVKTVSKFTENNKGMVLNAYSHNTKYDNMIDIENPQRKEDAERHKPTKIMNPTEKPPGGHNGPPE